MCGRYTLTEPLYRIQTYFSADLGNGSDPSASDWKPRYNIPPGQELPVIRVENGRRVIRFLRWGLIPSWAKDPNIGHRMINARSETLKEKPAFRNALRLRRCIIPANGFYEWKITGRAKTPMRIRLKNHEIFGFAGLWESWLSPEGKRIETFTVITTDANPFLRSVHDRMPVILRNRDIETWLDPKVQDPARLERILVPYDDSEIEAHPVTQPLDETLKITAPNLSLLI